MITNANGVKILNKIFYYPSLISDEWILNDPFRKLIDECFPENMLNIYENKIAIIFAHGIANDRLKALFQSENKKRILLVYCGENILGVNLFISHIHNGLKKVGVSSRFINQVLLNPSISKFFNFPSIKQHNQFIKELALNDSRYSFILTNDSEQFGDNIFFSPYFYFFCRDQVSLLQQKTIQPEIHQRKKFCAFVVSNPGNLDRINFYKMLSKYKKIDSFGKVLNNVDVQNLEGEHYLNLLKYNHLLFKDYKFVITFENSYAKGYITEKIVNALAGGSIPIYRGAPDIGSYFSTDRIIDFNNYNCSYQKMIDRIVELDEDDNKFNQVVSSPIFQNGYPPVGYLDFHQRLRSFIIKRLNIKNI